MNTLEAIVEWLMAASLRASVLALAILCIQALLWRWLPAQWRHALWLPMILVLALPVLPTVPFSLLPQPAAKEVKVVEASPVVAETETRENVTPQAVTHAAMSEPMISTKEAMALAWLLGAGIVLTVGIAGYRRSMRLVTKGALLPDEALQRSIELATRQAGLKRSPKVIVSPEVESPAVTGLFQPVLLLPSGFPEGFTQAESRLILLHELTHLKRKDLLVNWLTCVLQALHWFNPVLWFAFARLRADREAACDATVLSLDASDARSDYGTALLKLQSAAPARSLSLGFVGIFERGSELRSRIIEISSHRRNHPAWRAGGLLLITVVTFFGATKAQEPEVRQAKGPEPKVVVDGVDPNSGEAIIQRKLDAIVIPLISMENTSVEEAIDFMRVRSKELDTTETEPAKKGINFVIRKPRPGNPNVVDPGSLRVNMNLRNVPLRKIFDEICAQTDLKYKVDDFAVTFVPKSEPDTPDPVASRPRQLSGKAVGAANKVIIPVVDIVDASLEETVEFLNQRFQELSKDGQSYPIVLDPKVDGSKRIKELRLRNIPLTEAIKYCAEASRTTVVADDAEIRIKRH